MDENRVSMKNFYEMYRFKSNIEEFKRVVEVAYDMLRQDQLFILYGCVNEVNIETPLSRDEIESCLGGIDYELFFEILEDEISIILEESVTGGLGEKDDFEAFLSQHGLSDKEIARLCEERYQKIAFVTEKLMGDADSKRFMFKRKVLQKKLLDVGFNINQYVFDDETVQKYASLMITATNTLPSKSLPAAVRGVIGQKSPDVDAISFVCDKQDLNYLIGYLKNIRDRI